MTTITVKHSGNREPTDPEWLNINLHDDNPSERTLPELLIKVGLKLIEHGHHQEPEDWLSISQVSLYCRRYGLRCQGSPKGKELEYAVMDLFAKAGEIKNNGVRVEARTQWKEQKRRHQIYLKFTRIYPDGTCA